MQFQSISDFGSGELIDLRPPTLVVYMSLLISNRLSILYRLIIDWRTPTFDCRDLYDLRDKSVFPICESIPHL